MSAYKNGESGIVVDRVGNSIFRDIILSDNYRAGFQAHSTNFTAEEVVFSNSLIVGKSANGGEAIDYKTSAIIVPRTNGFKASFLSIFNFESGTSIIESSSENQHYQYWTQGGYSATVENLII